jgi:hypothetical protein
MECIKCKDQTNSLTKNLPLCISCRKGLPNDKNTLLDVERKIHAHYLKIPENKVNLKHLKRISNNFVLNIYKLNKFNECINAYDDLLKTEKELKEKSEVNQNVQNNKTGIEGEQEGTDQNIEGVVEVSGKGDNEIK